MKKQIVFALVALMAFSLVACTQNAPKQIKVKCPACGYEFMTPYRGN